MATIGRPPIEPLEQVTVRHMDTGRTVAWCNGVFSGDAELSQASRVIHEAGEDVRIGREIFPVSDDARGAAAAMLAACCGRGEVATDPTVLTESE